MTPTTEPKHYLLSDASKLLDVTAKHLRKVIKRNGFKFDRVGARLKAPGIMLLSKADVEALAAATKRTVNWTPCPHCNGTGRSNC